MRRPGRLLLPLVVLALAGCVAPDVPDAEAPTPALPPPREAALVQEGCTVVEVLLAVEPAKARALVPEHFEPVVGDAGTVAAALGGASCGEAGGGRVFFALSVEPAHEALRDEGVGRYFYEPDHGALPSGLLADALRQADLRGVPVLSGLDATSGPTAVLVRGEGPDATLAARTDAGPIPGRYPGSGGVFREYFAVEGGYGYFQASYGAMSGFLARPAAYEAGEGTAAREAVPPEGRGPAIAFVGLTFDDARVGFVPMP